MNLIKDINDTVQAKEAEIAAAAAAEQANDNEPVVPEDNHKSIADYMADIAGDK